ncbi:Inosine/uridine-preferring nucleoside hydrolase [Cystobacter fuscus DSM 2262]|uniref:Inosine/uridine-preferring nucleoside hydrolase n=1 Tax=Cystobacter fuscus (strain ATCC 25194 / DSM 2262 / NBRC 100088 / M29) TaxID=1242864 RepID=S9QU49_CYSF2|nr:nucleoside hydrolase [Cystobacter fuscus]EPX64859.1 Inosine/uridine-preferring nucleoside hydrolase [Cystobacter fuscus DSM 2262]
MTPPSPLFRWSAVLLSLSLAACRPSGAPVDRRTPVVIDTDMGSDDAMAIAFLLRRPDVEVKAITVTGAGLAHCEPGVRNALRLLALANHPDIPVACGRTTPLQGSHAYPDDWRQQADILNGVPLPEPRFSASASTAVQVLTSALEGSERKVTVLALGNLTNLAEALQARPSLAERVEQLYVMGGAVTVPGNVGDSPGVNPPNPYAEWNIYVDPEAAARVFETVPAMLVPLDATNHVQVTEEFLQRFEKDRQTAEADFVYRLLASDPDYVRSGTYFFWDPLAAASLAVEGIVTFEPKKVRVVVEEGESSGRTQEAETGHTVRAGVSADRQKFESAFLDTLNGRVHVP